MVKNVKEFASANHKVRSKFLRGLTLKRSAEIMKMLLTSRLWSEMFHKRNDRPLSVKLTLKHAR